MKLTDWPDIHERRGYSASTPPLALLSSIYGLGVRLRIIARKGMAKRSLPGFVVSIGNLTVGGTGKTPAARMMAEWALDQGYRVAILSRGYGGRYNTKILVVSDGDDINAGPVEAGDEPYLLAKRLQGVPVIISKNRYTAGLLAHKRFGTNFYILDDGFQHLALKRDLDLVLIDASSPFGNGHLLPWGPLREPIGQLERADAVIITRSGQSPPGDNLEGILEKRLQGRPLFRGDHIPENIVFPGDNRVHDPEFLRGKRIIAFAGIARPEVFKETLIDLGADLVSFKDFGDHHSFSPKELRELNVKKRKIKADLMVTTEKDWVRLENIASGYPDLTYLTIRFTLLSGQDRFFRMIKDRAERSAVFK
ncbi:MAG: tetraacyldisaccharide 4'-kinase [Deltaproteobacteria bacterium]|nr:tetraacyldisaccharide 4'-kinase [Deltaproteobacteria bacterium]